MAIIVGVLVAPFVVLFIVGVMYVVISTAWYLYSKIFGTFGGK